MKKAEIKVGGYYSARISGRFVTVRVNAIRETLARPYSDSRGDIKYREATVYDVTNLDTKRDTTFRSAAKFRRSASPSEVAALLNRKLGETV